MVNAVTKNVTTALRLNPRCAAISIFLGNGNRPSGFALPHDMRRQLPANAVPPRHRETHSATFVSGLRHRWQFRRWNATIAVIPSSHSRSFHQCARTDLGSRLSAVIA